MRHGTPSSTRFAQAPPPTGRIYSSAASPADAAELVRPAPLVKPVGTAGQHRQGQSAARARAARGSGGRRPQGAAHLVTKTLAIMIAFAVTAMVGYLIVVDERRGHTAEAGTLPDPAARLSSRATDPAPLVLTEVFPDLNEVHPPGATPYRITMTHIDTECRIATTGSLGTLLAERGCSQVVRAAMTAPYPGYQVTAGLFNLTDQHGAATVDDVLRHQIETGDGSFAAMGGGQPGDDPTAAPASQVGWHAFGHYLLYCVISRTDGRLVTDDDTNAARITTDLVDNYLAGTVLTKRAAKP